MADSFDPYQKWLGIPPEEQPPHFYRLLAIRPFEDDPDVITAAADQRMAYLRTLQSGKHADLSQKLLNQVAKAKVFLLAPEKKAKYDGVIRSQLAEAGAATPTAAQPQVARPSAAARPIPVSASPGRRPSSGSLGATIPVSRDQADASTNRVLLIALAATGAGILLVLGLVWAVSALSGGGADERASHETPPARQVEADEPSAGRTPPPPPAGAPPPAASASSPSSAESPQNDNPSDSPPVPTTNPTYHEAVRGATLAIANDCEIVPLRMNQRASNYADLVFTKVGKELDGYVFTRWAKAENDKIGCDVMSSGACFLIVRPEDEALLLPQLRAHSFRKTQIECELTLPFGKTVVCSVYRADLGFQSSVNFHMPQEDLWMVLASRSMRVARRGPLVAENPTVGAPRPPDTTGSTPDLDPDRVATNDPVPRTGAEPPAPVALLPIPPSSVQGELTREIESLFELDKGDKTAAELQQVAKLLIARARESADDPNSQFVMLRKACELAAEANDLTTSLVAVDDIAQRFECDRMAMRLKVAELAAKAKVPPPAKLQTYMRALTVVDEALQEDYFDEADALVTYLLKNAVRLRSRNLSQALAERKKAITAHRRAFAKVQDALETLKASPDDPEANLTAGQYFCYAKSDWEKGLAMLATSGDETLGPLARQSLAAPTEPADQLELGDAWFDVAEDEDEANQLAIYRYAETWFRRALPSLTALDKVRAEKRLGEIGEQTKGLARAGQPKSIFPCRGRIVAASDYRMDLAINGRVVISESSSYAVPASQWTGTFNEGDVIIVRVRRSSTRRAFACGIVFEGTKKYIATGPPDSGWMSYRPNSTTQWFEKGKGTTLGPAPRALGDAAQTVTTAAGFICRSIWGTYEDDNLSAYSYSYLLLELKGL